MSDHNLEGRHANTPVVIFCGGRGARFDAESQLKPKPLIEVAGKPILQHIIEAFQAQGFREFILPLGYLGEQVLEFAKYYSVTTDFKVTIRGIATGVDSHVGERLRKCREVIGARRFVMTYGDGLSDVQMDDVIKLHEQSGATVTMTAVRPPGRFGVVQFSASFAYRCCDIFPLRGYHREGCPGPGHVGSFSEKPVASWINGGFMAAEPEFIDQYIEVDNELERTALNELAASGGLYAYQHTGYWRCMDTRRDLEQIEQDVRDAGGRLPWLK